MSHLLRFMSDAAVFGGIAVVMASPVAIVGLRRGESETVRRFLLGALIVGIFSALVSLGSESLVRRCANAGNTDCVDYGAFGVQVLALGVYGVFSLLRAIAISRN